MPWDIIFPLFSFFKFIEIFVQLWFVLVWFVDWFINDNRWLTAQLLLVLFTVKLKVVCTLGIAAATPIATTIKLLADTRVFSGKMNAYTYASWQHCCWQQMPVKSFSLVIFSVFCRSSYEQVKFFNFSLQIVWCCLLFCYCDCFCCCRL